MQVSHADWLKGLMAGVVTPPQPANDLMPQASEPQPFPGFPAAGELSRESMSQISALARLARRNGNGPFLGPAQASERV